VTPEVPDRRTPSKENNEILRTMASNTPREPFHSVSVTRTPNRTASITLFREKNPSFPLTSMCVFSLPNLAECLSAKDFAFLKAAMPWASRTRCKKEVYSHYT